MKQCDQCQVMTINMTTIRYSADASICIVDDNGDFLVATQEDIDTLPVDDDLTQEEIDSLDS